MDVWRSGALLLYSCKSGFLNPRNVARTYCLMVEHSVVPWSMFAFWDGATPPHVHRTRPGRSLHVISFTSPLVVQATNAGVGRPGYGYVPSKLPKHCGKLVW